MTMPMHAPTRRNMYLLIPLGVGALVAIALGVYGKVHPPTGEAIVTGPFETLIGMKVWLTAVALVLALVQLLTALWMYGRLGGRAPWWVGAFHRGTGSIAFIVTLPVAFHCLWALGFAPAPATPRTLVHSLVGCLFYGAFVTKVLTLTSRRVPGWALPWVGGALFTTLVVTGLTSAVWYFTTVGAPS